MSKKIDKLGNIKKEVEDLHPLLEKLFPTLPDIADVEYTHGVNEMGADFILTQENKLFGNDYIGVVAKVGKLQSNFSDVERQIEECFEVKRYIHNGKKEIFLAEVWVVVTGNVTNNAKIKIHAKYVSKKIRFIDGRKLIDLVDEFLPVFWGDLPLLIGDYLNDVQAENRELDLKLSLLDVGANDLYIEQYIYEFSGQDYTKQRRSKGRNRKKVNIRREVEQERLVLIEGGIGSGKSKLLRHLVNHYTDPETFKDIPLLPISIMYKDLYDDFDMNIEKAIRSKVNTKVQDVLPEDAQYLFLVDAFDEKKLSLEEQLESLAKIKEHVLGLNNVKLVLTTRLLRGLENASDIDQEFARYEVGQLTLNQTIEFIQSLCSKFDIKTRLVEDLKKSALFKNIPRSPIIAILLAKLLNETDDLPSSMTELYAKYSELVLGRWDIQKGLQGEKEYRTLNNLFVRIARLIIESGNSGISVIEAKSILSAYLNERNLDVDEDQVFNRFMYRSDMVIISRDNHTLRFKHRTFAEFFYAQSLLNDDKFRLDTRAFDLYWMNTYFFYIGLHRDCPELLDTLTNLLPSSEPQRWLKAINMGNYFLAAYESKYVSVEKGIKHTILEIAQLYLDTIEKKSESPFAHMSQMHLLWLMQALVRASYAYTFFEDAIELAALEIDDGNYDHDIYHEGVRLYALFFLNAASLESGSSSSFDLLLEASPRQLPLDLSLALRYEADAGHVEVTRRMKKQLKRLRKSRRGNENLAKTIERMNSTPITLLPDLQ